MYMNRQLQLYENACVCVGVCEKDSVCVCVHEADRNAL